MVNTETAGDIFIESTPSWSRWGRRRDRKSLIEIADWVKAVCLGFGCSVDTAYRVAGEFVGGLKRDWNNQALLEDWEL